MSMGNNIINGYGRINRFNKSLSESNFLNDFQRLMIERLILSKKHKYSTKNLHQLILKHSKNRSNTIDLSIKNGLLLTYKIEADFYIMIQELLKEMFGKYQPMDQIIHILMSWFFITYKDWKNINMPKVVGPFIRKNNIVQRSKMYKFKKQFSKFQKNTIESWRDL